MDPLQDGPRTVDAGQAGRLVVVSAISGTGARKALKSFCDKRDEYTLQVFEDLLLDTARKHRASLRIPYPGRDLALPHLFELPEPVLRDLWRESLRGLAQSGRVEKALRGGHFVLLIHTCYYHLAASAFMSVVDLGALEADLGQIDCVIGLIDDIYDVYVRLTREGHLYSGGRGDIVRATLNLLRWRDSDVYHTKQLAATVGAPFYLVAMKHPETTLSSVIERKRPAVYLSHAISAARKAGLDDPASRELQKLLAGLSAGLRERFPGMPLIEPTTIDEYRFDADAIGRELQSAALSARWELPLGSDRSRAALLADGDPLSVEERRRASNPFVEAGVEDPARLAEVKDEVERQIKWRDRELVLQCPGLLVVRPFFGALGQRSRGVYQEMEFKKQQAAWIASKTPKQGCAETCFGLVYHPGADETHRRIKGVVAVLSHHLPDLGLSEDDLAAHDVDKVVGEYIRDRARDLEDSSDLSDESLRELGGQLIAAVKGARSLVTRRQASDAEAESIPMENLGDDPFRHYPEVCLLVGKELVGMVSGTGDYDRNDVRSLFLSAFFREQLPCFDIVVLPDVGEMTGEQVAKEMSAYIDKTNPLGE
jgi:hypothetical protein